MVGIELLSFLPSNFLGLQRYLKEDSFQRAVSKNFVGNQPKITVLMPVQQSSGQSTSPAYNPAWLSLRYVLLPLCLKTRGVEGVVPRSGYPITFDCAHSQNLPFTPMSAKEWGWRNGLLTLTLLLCVVVAVIAGSFVIDPPEHLSGTVIKKIHMPSNLRYANTVYVGTKRAGFSIWVVKEEQ